MKNKLFRLSAILLPVVLLILFEFVLRLSGYGQTYDLFITRGNSLSINEKICNKYFSKSDISIPQPISQKIPVHKTDSTFRIVCLGGSTTAGFPYIENINFPYFIKKDLQAKFPSLNIEVINLGISAIGSTVILDFMPQLKIIDPDLAIIYMGHNEFYGALGTASAEYAGENRYIIKSILWLRTLRFFQLLNNLYPSNDRNDLGQTLMSALAGEKVLPYKGEVYNLTHDLFSDNLIEIIENLKDDEIPVIVSTTTCNLRDQIPLDELSGIYPDSQRAQTAASRAYYKAKELLKINEIDSALKYFMQARDLDQIRFRASGDLNNIIRAVCLASQVTLVDMDKIFINHSHNDVPGFELFNEHVHPNAAGYRLMARAFIEPVYPIIEEKWNLRHEDRSLSVNNSALYSILDELIGEIKIAQLYRQFPFNGKLKFKFSEYDDPYIYQLAMAKNKREIFWDEAHYKLGDYYIAKGMYNKAMQEYSIVMHTYPDIAQPYYKLAAVYEKKGEWESSIEYYRKALVINSELAFIYSKLGIIYISRKRYTEGVSVLKSLTSSEKLLSDLNTEQISESFYLLGLAYASLTEYQKAREILNRTLELDPAHTKAQKLLGDINK